MHLLILGGRGFVGSRLANYFSSHTDWKIEALGSADVDLTDDDSVRVLQEKITEQTVVVFCSTISRLREDSFGAFQKNIAMARHVALALSAVKYRNLIFLSSIDVYGRPPADNPITEKTCVNPFGYYGLAKFASECILTNSLEQHKLTILRLPGVYSLDEDDPSALGSIFNHLKKNLPVMLTGSGKQIRAYLNVLELAHTIQSIVLENWSGLLNMVFSESVSLNEMTLTMKHYIQSSSPVTAGTENGTEFDIVIDTTKIRSVFPTISGISLAQYLNERCRLREMT